MKPLTRQEIYRVVYDYIGVSQGYLGDFSYRTHQEFYPRYCGLEIDPSKLEDMTTKERFIKILEEASPANQAKILRGVLAKYPCSSTEAHRTKQRYNEIQETIARLEALPLVSGPSPRITSAVVNRAINDAETLIAEQGATSGVDRVHTALQGYLMAACESAGITYGSDPSLPELLKLLKQQHPKLQNVGARSEELGKILKAVGTILDALNPIRNRASVAHPNTSLLDEDEARLVINAARTILHYLDAKLSGPREQF